MMLFGIWEIDDVSQRGVVCEMSGGRCGRHRDMVNILIQSGLSPALHNIMLWTKIIVLNTTFSLLQRIDNRGRNNTNIIC